MITLFLILLLLITAHFVADFCDFVYGGLYKKILVAKIEYKNLYWLYIHGLVNGLVYGLIAALFVPIISWIVLGVILIETLTHGAIDHGKSWIYRKYNLSYMNKGYWIFLGVDQLLHYIVILGLGFLIFLG